jgi:hypothetical protein
MERKQNMSNERIIHEFAPVAGDGLERVGEDDLLRKEFLVVGYDTGIPSTFNEGDTYTVVIVERSDGEKVKWSTAAKAIPDQLAAQELPFRATLVKRQSRTGREYLTFAPASEAEGPL